MKKLTATLCLGAMVGLGSLTARADEAPYKLNSSAAAQSGANRLGAATTSSPPHAWTATGQKPDAISSDDTKKEHPRNRAVVGPPVPAKAKTIPQPPPPPVAPEPDVNE
jgi:hypothetical protein